MSAISDQYDRHRLLTGLGSTRVSRVWRARPRDRELSPWIHTSATGEIQSKDCFGATPKVRAGLAPAREMRALPRLMPLAHFG